MRILQFTSAEAMWKMFHRVLLQRAPPERTLESASDLLLRLPGTEETHRVSPEAPLVEKETLTSSQVSVA
jgi:hypothetical protein